MLKAGPPCVVRSCKNIGNHFLPADETRRAAWIQAIEHVKPRLKIRKCSKICSAHFRPSDYCSTLLPAECAPKILKKTAIPSIFPWKPAPPEVPAPQPQTSLSFNATKLKNTYARKQPITLIEEPPILNIALDDINQDPLEESCDTDDKTQLQLALSESKRTTDKKITEDGYEIDFLEEKKEPTLDNTERKDKPIDIEGYVFSIHNLKDDDKMIHFYTGLGDFNKVLNVFDTLKQHIGNLNYVHEKPPEELEALEQFFITLLILRRCKPIDEVAMLYKISITKVFNVYTTWIRFMSQQWERLDHWVKGEVVEYMPIKVKIYLNKEKYRKFVKFVIGITASGLISYISPCYSSTATDKALIKKTIILNGLNDNDSNENIASKRVGIRTVMDSLKSFWILSKLINKTESMLSSDIVFVCAMLVNFETGINKES